MNLLKRFLISTGIVYALKNNIKYLINLLKKGLLNLGIQKKRINPRNFIYKYKTEGRSSKKFRNYQNPIELFKNLRGDNINPKEVLKDQINFKSNLGEIKKENPKSKSED